MVYGGPIYAIISQDSSYSGQCWAWEGTQEASVVFCTPWVDLGAGYPGLRHGGAQTIYI